MELYANSDRASETIAATRSKPGSPNVRSMSPTSLTCPVM